MRRTRLSLYYLAGYLTLTGLGLVVMPGLVLQLLFSNRQYDDIFPRFAGALMLALGILVIQTMRLNATALYSASLAARALIWAISLGLFIRSGDPFFVVVLAVVGFGMILTGSSYYLDRRDRHRSGVKPSA